MQSSSLPVATLWSPLKNAHETLYEAQAWLLASQSSIFRWCASLLVR